MVDIFKFTSAAASYKVGLKGCRYRARKIQKSIRMFIM